MNLYPQTLPMYTSEKKEGLWINCANSCWRPFSFDIIVPEKPLEETGFGTGPWLQNK